MFRTMQAFLERKREHLPRVREYGRLVERVIEVPGIERDLGDSRLGGAGWIGEDGLIHGIHVTDNPGHVVEVLRAGVPLAVGRTRREKYGDLGPGLYISAAPQLWKGRGTRKWDFLETLKAPEAKPLRHKLAMAIIQHRNISEPGYISKYERERAALSLDRYVEDGREYIVYLADQPYNVRFHEPVFLKPLGITPGPVSHEVEVVLRGRYAELRHHPSIDEIKGLQTDPMLDGAYTRSGFGTYPQLVVWNNDAVVRFGAED